MSLRVAFPWRCVWHASNSPLCAPILDKILVDRGPLGIRLECCEPVGALEGCLLRRGHETWLAKG